MAHEKRKNILAAAGATNHREETTKNNYMQIHQGKEMLASKMSLNKNNRKVR